MGLKSNSLVPYFLQCFDTVGWVIWPVKNVPDMTYNVFGGMLNVSLSIYCSLFIGVWFIGCLFAGAAVSMLTLVMFTSVVCSWWKRTDSMSSQVLKTSRQNTPVPRFIVLSHLRGVMFFRPVWGRGTPLPPLAIYFIFSPSYFFPFFPCLYLFSSFVHPFPFYQNSPTPFPGRRS